MKWKLEKKFILRSAKKFSFECILSFMFYKNIYFHIKTMCNEKLMIHANLIIKRLNAHLVTLGIQNIPTSIYSLNVGIAKTGREL